MTVPNLNQRTLLCVGYCFGPFEPHQISSMKFPNNEKQINVDIYFTIETEIEKKTENVHNVNKNAVIKNSQNLKLEISYFFGGRPTFFLGEELSTGMCTNLTLILSFLYIPFS